VSPWSETAAPRFVYDERYVEPEIQLLVLEAIAVDSDADLLRTTRMNRYKPTGARTSSGLYQYELVEESSLF